MDTQFVWKDEYNIGVEMIDKEHQRLFKIINKLFVFREEEKDSQWTCQEGIKYFRSHAMKHFMDEEAYMLSIGYEGLEQHRLIHKGFRENTLPALEQELERTGYAPDAVNHFLGVCAGWLIGHTLTEDRAIVGTAPSKWVGLLPEVRQVAMKEVIVKLLNELFQLNARVISESYGGEKFGKGIYYRLVYGSENAEKWEFFLIYEEKVLLNTMGRILGCESGKVDTMLMNATRYTARQFVERIMAHFYPNKKIEVLEENLLNYEQFQRMFGRQSLQYGLLFDTGEGYFAFCLTAPHLLDQKGGAPIKVENAMDEIKKYLGHTEEAGRKKILVVDDSGIMLQAMKELLQTDYQVSLARSGMAALRSMVLDRPDLVLLDYEMPVCDGRQVLEMIRSEEELKDIPVIFLTGRYDKESVSRVVSLKPAGYLLKTMNPGEIKKNVDEFMKKL